MLPILQPGRVLRLVLPDFYEMATKFCTLRKKGDHEKADFHIIELTGKIINIEENKTNYLSFKNILSRIISQIERYWIKIVLLALPSAFVKTTFV